MRKGPASLLAIALLAAGSAHADNVDAVRQAAQAWLVQHYSQPGSRALASAEPLAARTVVPACPQGWRGDLSSTARPAPRMSVAMTCPTGAKVQVPVKLQLFRTVLVTNRPLQRGDGVTAGDVRGEERDITRLGYGYLDQLDDLGGRLLSRPLGTGSVLTPGAFGARQAVRPGDHVQMVARINGIEVRAGGVALSGGDTGARLRVRNDSSGRAVDAMVQGPGLVEALP
ncbi:MULTISPECIES: flagellar basal body P-ring formation chaperone FlgA [Dyella]|uniref:Flagella basal body P-ring formation protein FlgA n=2 Tax=Dyella TaxID=231454 RepID=A0A4R0YH44_9GAMM|nr:MULTISPECIES: flagellar basal body P-ring formation chaperone FlgA [Dyella]TBR37178.1 flagellar basal body P-ring formation protein FlgA [Dyella terrae]TCI07732.1 flagellar basal body P-ring formation protein FlgA [Dyella soli]